MNLQKIKAVKEQGELRMLNMKLTLSAVMLAAAFAGTSSLAVAQAQNYRGTFELQVEARFGKIVLPPGSYTVSTIEGAKGLRITGEKGNASLLAAGYDLRPGTEKARMILVDAGGMYTLQSFESGAMGKSLHFYVGKNPRGTERAASRPAIEVGLQ
jgi:hypothetical protein